MIPETSHDAIIDAMRQFDATERTSDAWQGWERKAQFRRAIWHEDKEYPVGHIVASAEGGDSDYWMSEEEATEHATNSGFEVRPLREVDPEGTALQRRAWIFQANP